MFILSTYYFIIYCNIQLPSYEKITNESIFLNKYISLKTPIE